MRQAKVVCLRACTLSASNEEQGTQLFLVWQTLIKLTTLCPYWLGELLENYKKRSITHTP